MSFRLVPKSLTLNGPARRHGRYIALFHWIWWICVATRNRVDLWRRYCTSLLYFVVRVRRRRKKSSRSLSHLVMSFLYHCTACAIFIHVRLLRVTLNINQPINQLKYCVHKRTVPRCRSCSWDCTFRWCLTTSWWPDCTSRRCSCAWYRWSRRRRTRSRRAQ